MNRIIVLLIVCIFWTEVTQSDTYNFYLKDNGNEELTPVKVPHPKRTLPIAKLETASTKQTKGENTSPSPWRLKFASTGGFQLDASTSYLGPLISISYLLKEPLSVTVYSGIALAMGEPGDDLFIGFDLEFLPIKYYSADQKSGFSMGILAGTDTFGVSEEHATFHLGPIFRFDFNSDFGCELLSRLNTSFARADFGFFFSI